MGKVILNRNKTRKMLKCRKEKFGKDLDIFVGLLFLTLDTKKGQQKCDNTMIDCKWLFNLVKT